jgi:adenine-specific DNA-methyltransferase
MLLTSTELADIWKISSRRISVLCSEGRVIGAFKKGKTWLIPSEARKPIDSRKKTKNSQAENTLSIQNRRYLGNKYKLVGFIDKTIKKHCPGVQSLFDVFAGTGVVAYHFMDKMKVIANDTLYSNYLAYIAFMSDVDIDFGKVSSLVKQYNDINASELKENYMSKVFANTYFSLDDCKKIGYVRENIEKLFKDGSVNKREYAILVTTLLYAMDRIANTCGHYDAYRKGVEYDKHIILRELDLSKKRYSDNLLFNEDSNKLIQEKDFPFVDCVYCDPPYNSRNYCDLYHVLENVAEWKKPKVIGVAKKMDRSGLKSKYCGKDAAKAFEDLVKNLKCKYIVLSYNNTGDGADDRSNARMSDEDILKILSSKGAVKIYSQQYKAFTTGKSNNQTNQERLFVCKVQSSENIEENKKYIKSPLNYTGGKSKLLPQLMPLFPKKINTFIDLFCGGGNVGINATAQNIIYNDNNAELIEMFKSFVKIKPQELIEEIEKIISTYGLSCSEKNGYEFYGCNSKDGLGVYNKMPFCHLRNDFNADLCDNAQHYLKLYTLIVYSFNNQIRFNSNGKFNLPVGKRDFNKNIKNNLRNFMTELNKQNCKFKSRDFRTLEVNKLRINDFVYCDPPYLITTASYNERNGWNEKDEKALLCLLDAINAHGTQFALSNVLKHKGRTNDILVKWSSKYNIHTLNYNYNNSNYHAKHRDKITKEVLITNY